MQHTPRRAPCNIQTTCRRHATGQHNLQRTHATHSRKPYAKRKLAGTVQMPLCGHRAHSAAQCSARLSLAHICTDGRSAALRCCTARVRSVARRGGGAGGARPAQRGGAVGADVRERAVVVSRGRGDAPGNAATPARRGTPQCIAARCSTAMQKSRRCIDRLTHSFMRAHTRVSGWVGRANACSSQR